MKKVLKKVLFISDDFDSMIMDRFLITKKFVEPGNIYYSKESNWLKFKIDLIKSFQDIKKKKIKDYDCILIDYGLLGDKKENIKIITDIHNKQIPIGWCGGLSARYNDDAKDMFPKLKFLHNLPSSSTGHEEILFILYEIFGENKDKVEQ